MRKIESYGVPGVSNDLFKSYLPNCNQYVSINGYKPVLAPVNSGFPQGTVPGHLLFSLYINNLNKTIKFYIVHHFANDTNYHV